MNFEILSVKTEKEAIFNCYDDDHKEQIATVKVKLTEDNFKDCTDDDIVLHVDDVEKDEINYSVVDQHYEIVDQIFEFIDDKITLFVFDDHMRLSIMTASEFCDLIGVKNYRHWASYNAHNFLAEFDNPESSKEFIKESDRLEDEEKEELINEINDYVKKKQRRELTKNFKAVTYRLFLSKKSLLYAF